MAHNWSQNKFENKNIDNGQFNHSYLKRLNEDFQRTKFQNNSLSLYRPQFAVIELMLNVMKQKYERNPKRNY